MKSMRKRRQSSEIESIAGAFAPFSHAFHLTRTIANTFYVLLYRWLQLYSQVKGLRAHTESIKIFAKELNKRYKNKIRKLNNPPKNRGVPEICEHHVKNAIQEIRHQTVLKPSPTSTFDECFSYYLETF